MRDPRHVVPVLLMFGTLLAPLPASAQDATPPPGEATPAPRAMLQPCAAEAPNLDQLVTLWFDAAGTPLATPAPVGAIVDLELLPPGGRADEATVAAITETTLGWISCLEYSGQPSRGFSYMTDRFIARFGPDLSNPEQDTAADVRASLEAQLVGTPVPNEVLSPLVGPRRARVLDDGRVGAVWALGGDRYFFLYQQVDGRWLIDDAIDVLEVEGTPVAATPAP